MKFGCAALIAGTIFAGPAQTVASASVQSATPIQLTSAESVHTPLGDGPALVMGASGVPLPSSQWVETATDLYLKPFGFTGTAEALYTPEWTTFPDFSLGIGATFLTTAIMSKILLGHVDADDPVAVFGYSQSSALITQTMQGLHALGVSPDDVHFVLVGNGANPNGGLLSSLNPFPGSQLTFPSLNFTLGASTPDDLYHADVYTMEYDGYADFPRYALNTFSDLNAVMGMFYSHLMYLGLSPDQIANAIQLDTTPGGLVDYYMIPSEYLPLLMPVALMPVIGKPLYDLLEPDMRIMVNLGYGSITDGWNQGPANVDTPISLSPFAPDTNWSDVFTALGNGWTQGVNAAIADLQDPETYKSIPLVDQPILQPIVDGAYGAGFIDAAHPPTDWQFLTSWMGTWFSDLSGSGSSFS
ncbi:PE-PPE domain-containing protein [Mycobacterium sp. M1]|uniref:PE-PPE domain-containing protein n=1 Tax=Mycolicibacter acidiphilus TaxID=2835306 RepID=A0ABS5RED7_9MYCO|nr:PE-PPE domain-containing protein [Mycolicibacter acidiphilus]MBS9532638.1 PE-PPE domain-containing protein [Mycolicibacter acidiphilus]